MLDDDIISVTNTTGNSALTHKASFPAAQSPNYRYLLMLVYSIPSSALITLNVKTE
jgi:hypothetical protein